MGYEILYKYHSLVNGDYNKAEKISKSIMVGDFLESIDIDVLAGKVMALMARRNILVTDIEIYEIEKKKISFKESDDGILIKNRKYKFDDSATVSSVEVKDPNATTDTDKLLELIRKNPDLLKSIDKQTPVATAAPQKQTIVTTGSPLRHEIFNPPKELLQEGRKLNFTIGKKYPIYAEKPAGPDPRAGTVYLSVNDTGDKRYFPEVFFVPVPGRLAGDFEADAFTPDLGGNGKLVSGASEGNYEMPDLRR